MAAVTTNADSSPTETLTDDALIAEIPPAMLAKLKRDGGRYGMAMCGFWMFWALVSYHALSPYRTGAYVVFVETLQVALLVLTLACSIAGLAFRPAFAQRSVRQELLYRRQQGKWRWDH